jgi:hypothetical protein
MCCPIGRRKAAENIHEISIGVSLNAVPFEERAIEVIQHGITFNCQLVYYQLPLDFGIYINKMTLSII